MKTKIMMLLIATILLFTLCKKKDTKPNDPVVPPQSTTTGNPPTTTLTPVTLLLSCGGNTLPAIAYIYINDTLYNGLTIDTIPTTVPNQYVQFGNFHRQFYEGDKIKIKSERRRQVINQTGPYAVSWSRNLSLTSYPNTTPVFDMSYYQNVHGTTPVYAYYTPNTFQVHDTIKYVIDSCIVEYQN